MFSQEKVTTELNEYLTTDFTGSKYEGKLYEGGGETVLLRKFVGQDYITEDVTVSVKHDGSSINNKLYGLNILFENGESIIRSKQELVSYYTEENGHQYKAMLELNKNDIYLFKTQKVTSVKLNKYSSNVSENESNAILKAAKIMLTTPNK
jgi:predicted transcriptional regulator with HTH domain